LATPKSPSSGSKAFASRSFAKLFFHFLSSRSRRRRLREALLPLLELALEKAPADLHRLLLLGRVDEGSDLVARP